MNSINTRYAVITGASQGIGEHLTKHLATMGYSVILASRNFGKLSQLAEDLEKKRGIKALPIECDLSLESGVQKLIEFCSSDTHEIEVFINNAGFGDLGEFTEQTWEVFAQMIDLNIKALTQLSHFFAIRFKQRKRGFILNVASTAAFQPDPYFSVYGATKAFVLSFSEALREELAPHGVQVSVLCPGPTDTPFHLRAGTDQSLFVTRFMAPVEKVAAKGITGLFSGKTVIVPGLINNILILIIRFSPRAAVARLASLMLRKP
ncbi:MAG: SDR family oxidoreductase [Proteobacteria bacterium]|nr:SDR family oxidoreductase [Pseudomonadota bacterium]NDC24497.1 SDR family oxidoreductase [Pseudomonadota bacterium]NDD04468.1 SDR family oxidoreductase [Pseudomonadota bacterium]NDG27957.1 SDR family oxidoreductase [Pseudomonadota bacterium]